MRRILPVLLALVLLSSCSQRRGVVTVKVIATSDVHGRFFDKDCLDGNERPGSLAKFSTYIRQVRKDFRNVVYVDCGDILQGSVETFQDMTSEFYKPSLAASIYNWLGCDAAAFGNHDISVGVSSYERFFRSVAFPVIGSNVYFDDYGDYLPACTVVERHGVRIGLIGLTTQVVNWSVPSDIISDLRVHDMIESASYLTSVLKDETDVIIAVVHSGYDGGRIDVENRVRELAMSVPDIDAVIYGHDHLARCEKLVNGSDSVLVINPGAGAVNAADVTLTVDFRDRNNPAVSVSGSIASLTSLPADPEFISTFSDRYADVMAYSDSIIGKATVPLESGCALWRPASAIEYIHSIQMRFSGAQVSLTAPVALKGIIRTDTMSVRDVFSLYPFDNNMVSVMMKGSEIRRVLEHSVSKFYNTVGNGAGPLLKMKPDGRPQCDMSRFITACGIDYTVNVTKPEGKRVDVVSMSDGTPFSDDAMYRTTINSFLFSGTESPLREALGVGLKDFAARQNLSSPTDLKYYIITAFALKNEEGREVRIPRYANWKLVPENVTDGFLAVDTVNFKFKL